MISKMAMDDIAQLRADGIDVPPREVVRLNALGLKGERGADCAEVCAAPRIAFVGDVVLHEPTIGGEMWLGRALDAFNGDDAQTYFALRLMMCVIPWAELPDPTSRRAVVKAAKRVQKSLAGATDRQVLAALEWCIGGNSPETGETPPPKPSTDDADDDLPARYSPVYGLFYRGLAVRLGNADDLKDMTTSAMMAVCERAEMLAIATVSAVGGGADRKAEKNKAIGDYFRALDAVVSAAKAKKEAT